MAEENGSRRGMGPGLLIAVLTVAGVAGYLSFRGQRESDAQLDSAESAVAYICLDDGHVFHVTPADFERLVQQGQAQTGGSETGVLTLRCPKCEKITAVRAQECEKDHTWFPRRLRDTAPGKCPKCGGSFYAPPGS